METTYHYHDNTTTAATITTTTSTAISFLESFIIVYIMSDAVANEKTIFTYVSI